MILFSGVDSYTRLGANLGKEKEVINAIKFGIVEKWEVELNVILNVLGLVRYHELIRTISLKRMIQFDGGSVSFLLSFFPVFSSFYFA